MEAATLAIAIDLVGWVLWFALTRQLSRDGAAGQWVTVDYYISTVLLALSTASTAAGTFLTDPVLVTRVAVPLLVGGLGILAARTWRSTARTVRMQYTSDAGAARPGPQPKAPEPQWRTVTAPPPRGIPATVYAYNDHHGLGDILSDPLIQEIESRRMTA